MSGPDGYDRYVGLWEFLITVGVPPDQVNAHLDDVIVRLEERVDVLRSRPDVKEQELREVEIMVKTLQRTRAQYPRSGI